MLQMRQDDKKEIEKIILRVLRRDRVPLSRKKLFKLFITVDPERKGIKVGYKSK